MTTRAAVRRSLLNALLDLERIDDAALDHAFQHAQRAAFGILDLRGSSAPVQGTGTHHPCGEHSQGSPSTPTDTGGHT